MLLILELTVGFETNLQFNIFSKNQKHQDLKWSLKQECKDAGIINLLISASGLLFTMPIDSFDILQV